MKKKEKHFSRTYFHEQINYQLETIYVRPLESNDEVSLLFKCRGIITVFHMHDKKRRKILLSVMTVFMLRMKGYYFDLIKIKLSGHNFFIKRIFV